MNTWSVQEAKSRFSVMLDACITDGAQIVTRHGAEIAVLVPIAEWKRLHNASRRTLKSVLLSDEARFDMELPPRGAVKRRAPPLL
jgi:antitoxin Phd